MTLNELLSTLAVFSDQEVVDDVVAVIQSWKSNNDTVDQLVSDVEALFDSSAVDHFMIVSAFEQWTSFKRDSVAQLEGMTTNERLYTFSLSESLTTPIEMLRDKVVF